MASFHQVFASSDRDSHFFAHTWFQKGSNSCHIGAGDIVIRTGLLGITKDAVADQDRFQWNSLVKCGNLVHLIDVIGKDGNVVS